MSNTGGAGTELMCELFSSGAYFIRWRQFDTFGLQLVKQQTNRIVSGTPALLQLLQACDWDRVNDTYSLLAHEAAGTHKEVNVNVNNLLAISI